MSWDLSRDAAEAARELLNRITLRPVAWRRAIGLEVLPCLENWLQTNRGPPCGGLGSGLDGRLEGILSE